MGSRLGAYDCRDYVDGAGSNVRLLGSVSDWVSNPFAGSQDRYDYPHRFVRRAERLVDAVEEITVGALAGIPAGGRPRPLVASRTVLTTIAPGERRRMSVEFDPRDALHITERREEFLITFGVVQTRDRGGGVWVSPVTIAGEFKAVNWLSTEQAHVLCRHPGAPPRGTGRLGLLLRLRLARSLVIGWGIRSATRSSPPCAAPGRRVLPGPRSPTSFKRNRSAPEISQATGILTQYRLAACDKDRRNDGRPVERWVYTGNEINETDEITPEPAGVTSSISFNSSGKEAADAGEF